MKKFWRKGLTMLLAAGLFCLQGLNSAEAGTLKVAAYSYPYGQILQEAQPRLAQQGVNLEIVGYSEDPSEALLPNLDLLEGKVDACFYQREVDLDPFVKEHGLNIVQVCSVFVEPMGIYSKQVSGIDSAWPGSQVIVPADGYMGRALKLLETADIVELKSDANYFCDDDSIVKMLKPFKIIYIAPEKMPGSYHLFQLAVMNLKEAKEAGLNPLKDAFMIEWGYNPYAGVLATLGGKETSEDIQKLAEVLQSPEMRDFINSNYDGNIVPIF